MQGPHRSLLKTPAYFALPREAMNKDELIRGLRNLAEELKPFTQEVKTGGRVWNGTTYAQTAPRHADPYALMWWGILTSIAELLEAQDAPASEKQVTLLRKKLFGGMGSFNDYNLDATRLGDAAESSNRRLKDKRTALFRLFP